MSARGHCSFGTPVNLGAPFVLRLTMDAEATAVDGTDRLGAEDESSWRVLRVLVISLAISILSLIALVGWATLSLLDDIRMVSATQRDSN